jgi:hypothetical protein
VCKIGHVSVTMNVCESIWVCEYVSGCESECESECVAKANLQHRRMRRGNKNGYLFCKNKLYFPFTHTFLVYYLVFSTSPHVSTSSGHLQVFYIHFTTAAPYDHSTL